MAATRQRNYDIVLICDHCHDHFNASRYDAKYCSAICRQRARRAELKARNARQNALDGVFKYLALYPDVSDYENALTGIVGAIQSNSFVRD